MTDTVTVHALAHSHAIQEAAGRVIVINKIGAHPFCFCLSNPLHFLLLLLASFHPELY